MKEKESGGRGEPPRGSDDDRIILARKEPVGRLKKEGGSLQDPQ